MKSFESVDDDGDGDGDDVEGGGFAVFDPRARRLGSGVDRVNNSVDVPK